MLRRKQADELARQAQNNLYYGELERVASKLVDIFGSDSSDSEDDW